MRYKIDHDYHIHTLLSSCSQDPEQTSDRILQYAKENGLTGICVTDHYWDSAVLNASNWYAPQNFEHISQVKPLPTDKNIDFLFGCETDMNMHMTIGIPPQRFDNFDFIIISTTHLHMTEFTISKEDAERNERRAQLWVDRFDALLHQPLPFGKIGIAHLASDLIAHASREQYLEVLNSIPTDEMERLFSKSAELGCGIELNRGDMSFNDSEENIVLRPFRIAKSCGCKFYLGSDAHRPNSFTYSKQIFERAITRLDLKETDKFHIVKN